MTVIQEEKTMKEMQLKYGCNPNQKPSRVFVENGELPIEVLSGNPGYINLLDAFNGWQLVRELKKATGLPIAAKVAERRAGDPARLVASSEKARKVLGWNPEHADLEEIISSAWKWHSTHPNGFEK